MLITKRSTARLLSNSPSASTKPTGIQKHTNHKWPRPRPRKVHPKILGPVDDKALYDGRMSSPLLRLPAELRLMIWQHALSSPTGALKYNATTKRFDVSSIAAGLLTTCHSIALETQFLPLMLNTLVFEVPSKQNVDFMTFWGKIMSVQGALDWVLKTDVSFENGPV